MKTRTPTAKNVISLYGRRNDRHPPEGQPCYWTDWRALLAERRRLSGCEPFWINVTSRSTDPIFKALSPMQMGPVNCYRENGRLVTAVNAEVAWQYSKVYSHIRQDGELVDISSRFITCDRKGKPMPSPEWFRWRDAAYRNPDFSCHSPKFAANRKWVRSAFPRGSVVAFWYWDGKLLNSVQARQRIYARLYRKFVVRTAGFRRLRQVVEQGRDLFIYDNDGYDWIRLNMTPADCIRAPHSFGHGMVIAFLLLGIDPTRIITN